MSVFCSKCWIKHLMVIFSFNFQAKPKTGYYYPSFVKRENRDVKEVAMVTQLLDNGAKIQTQVCRTSKLLSLKDLIKLN